jgi:serine/threonine-protein phosphatase PP1 catalytic subunit
MRACVYVCVFAREPTCHSCAYVPALVSSAILLASEDRLLHLSSPMYVLGDIHGNLTDLRFFSENLWTLGMPLTAGTFLFLGDYVDRGHNSLEVVAYLFALKVINQ